MLLRLPWLRLPGRLLAVGLLTGAASFPVAAQTATATPAAPSATSPAAAPELARWTTAEGAAAGGATPAAPWRVAALPGGKIAPTRFTLALQDAQPVLRIEAEASYANLVHDLPRWTPTAQATLQWRWRLDQPLANADLRNKRGDDAALKVCVMYDLPLAQVPLFERGLLQLARRISGEPLPAATVCYLWDPSLPAGTALDNAHSRRVRYLVLDGQGSPTGRWQAHQRPLQADFLRLFGDESRTVPPLLAVAVGADADNTGGRSLAWLADIRIVP